jgi:hypothetical protein
VPGQGSYWLRFLAGRTPSVPVWGFHYGKRFMSGLSPNHDKESDGSCKWCISKGLDVGEYLANSVHLLTAGRDLRTERKGADKKP